MRLEQRVFKAKITNIRRPQWYKAACVILSLVLWARGTSSFRGAKNGAGGEVTSASRGAPNGVSCHTHRTGPSQGVKEG